MASNEVIIVVIFFLLIIYFILGFFAYSSIEHKEKMWSFSFTVWFIDKDEFNNFGKSICPPGKVLFISILAALALMFIT